MRSFLVIVFLMFASHCFGALTTTSDANFPCGNKLCLVKTLTFTSVTAGEVKTGLHDILYASYTPTKTATSPVVYINSASASAVEDDLGSIYLNGVTSGDTGMLFIIGR